MSAHWMSELAEIFASTPWLLAGCVILFGLLVGSFLNVVIHRLPIMLEREWKAQAQELLGETNAAPGAQEQDPKSVTSRAAFAHNEFDADPLSSDAVDAL